MYPDSAFYEFYPPDIVEKILREHPDASIEEKNRLMQTEWDATKSQPSMAELADDFGL